MKIICMRGLPGSGKSLTARQLKEQSHGLTCILSTDDYFMCDGIYLYDGKQIPAAHQWNQGRALRAAAAGHPLIIIDNTNMQLWEMRPYLQIADKFGYEFETVDTAADSEEACAARNLHKVPLEIIRKMAANYQKFDGGKSQILEAKAPWEK